VTSRHLVDLRYPAEASGAFGAGAPLAVRYAEMLAAVGVERGLIGPQETERIWPRHLLNALALLPFLPAGAHVVDVGSGAGLPGVPLAVSRPDLVITLAEPMQRRAQFLREVVDELALSNVCVERARAQELPPAQWDVAVARAVAPLERLVPMLAPLARPGGRVLALKGDKVGAELERAQQTVPGLAVLKPRTERVDVVAGVAATVVVLDMPPTGWPTGMAKGRTSRQTGRRRGGTSTAGHSDDAAGRDRRQGGQR
jgi:16S rRNA (guanine527-N7)-methyltransferase